MNIYVKGVDINKVSNKINFEPFRDTLNGIYQQAERKSGVERQKEQK